MSTRQESSADLHKLLREHFADAGCGFRLSRSIRMEDQTKESTTTSTCAEIAKVLNFGAAFWLLAGTQFRPKL